MELHNLTFKEFKKLFGPPATKLLRGQRARHKLKRAFGLLWTKDQFLRNEHAKLILMAIQSGQEVEREIVAEYKEHPATKKAIEDYCKRKGWYLR